MKMMIVGAGRGLGRALLEGLGKPGDTLIGVSRKQPSDLALAPGIDLHWIDADLANQRRLWHRSRIGLLPIWMS